MKMLCVIVFLFGMFSHSLCQTTIESFPLSICCNKTTNLIFSYPVKSVDRGSKEILVQKANSAENILQVKAATENFQATNLSVITSDGRLFSFIVSYDQSPAKLNISFAGDSTKHLSANQIELTAEKLNDFILAGDASVILKQKHFLHRKVISEGMKLTLLGIYIKDNVLWFLLKGENHSFLDYHPEYLHCFIADKRKTARSAIQETDLPLLFPAAPLEPVPGKKKKHFVLAFAPFTFSENKKMIVQLSEKNGGRAMILAISHRAILKAKAIK
jgi:conjugative transposon TraN protein